MLEIKNLHASVGGTEILKGLDLVMKPGEIHAIMGPNGAGKSTLSYILTGRAGYDITKGSIKFLGKDLSELSVDERAAAGIFLAFQYPLEIPGVPTMTFLRTAVNAQRVARGEEEMSPPDFLRKVREKSKLFQVEDKMLRRPLNVGFSGGEKKRMEVLQMAMLEPKLAILDETDSGLDIDSLRIVAEGVNAMRGPDRSALVITHYQRLLDYIIPDVVHVLADGRIVKSGDKTLAQDLEKHGYENIVNDAA